MSTAPLFAISVPLIVVRAAMDIAPSAIQNTLHANAPLTRFTVAEAEVASAPPVLKINTALGLLCASSVSTALTDAAQDME